MLKLSLEGRERRDRKQDELRRANAGAGCELNGFSHVKAEQHDGRRQLQGPTQRLRRRGGTCMVNGEPAVEDRVERLVTQDRSPTDPDERS